MKERAAILGGNLEIKSGVEKKRWCVLNCQLETRNRE
jgi:hypothetical protein